MTNVITFPNAASAADVICTPLNITFPGGNMDRRDRFQAPDAPGLAPSQEFGGRLSVGAAGVRVADLRSEEFQKTKAGCFPCSVEYRQRRDVHQIHHAAPFKAATRASTIFIR